MRTPGTWARRALAALLGAATLVVAVPGTASAHPLGNFTVNRFSGIVVASESVTVAHVLDIAEIPTAQRKSAIDTSGDGAMSRTELAAWARPTCRDAAGSLRLTVAGDKEPLAVATAGARTLPGQAGLPVLRVECALRAAIPSLSGTIVVRLVDTAGEGEVGWKEMTAQGDGTTVTSSDVPERSRSSRLTSYPGNLLSSPLDVLSAELSVRPGGPALQTDSSGSDGAVLPSGPLGRGADRLTSAFEGLLERADDGPLLGLVALLGAVLLGAAHAMAPGHGKTIMAFYLSGRRAGALRAAATVGGTVTATHTAGVLLLGVIASAGTALAPAEVYPWLSVASGLLVVAVGIALLRAARRGAPGHTHGTGPGQHTHGPVPATVPARGELVTSVAADQGTHAGLGSTVEATAPHHEHHEHPSSPGASDPAHHHDHDHDHQHQHEAPPEHTHEVADLSPRGLVAIGLAGGLLPSPSAVIVFLGALGLGRPWFGVALVIAFGVGMATTLAVVGLLVMRLRVRAEARLASRPTSRFAPILRVIPLFTAIAVVVLGAALALRGLSSTGVV